MQLTEFTYFYPDKARLLKINQPLFDTLANHPDWLAQLKFNGSHLELHYFNNEFQFWNRHGQLMAYKPSQDVLNALHTLKLQGYWIFDGELRHNKVIGIRNRIVLWDVFVANGTVLHKVAYEQRFALLLDCFDEEVRNPSWFNEDHILSPAQVFTQNLKEVFYSQEDKEIEGLVLKNRQGHLLLGRTKAQESPWAFKVRKPK